MRLPPKPKHPFLAKYQALPVPEGVKAITQLWGSFDAPVLLIAEHPTQEEVDNGLAFSGHAARIYQRAMVADTGFEDINKSFLVMPCSRFRSGRGEKPNKASTEHTFNFIWEAIPSLPNLVCVVCIGMTSFGVTFAGGRKTHARSIIGNPMFLPQLHTLPVIVLPDTNYLTPDPDKWREVRFASDKLKSIQNLTLNLHQFVQQQIHAKKAKAGNARIKA